ncbi:MAG TPA: hypothetical protein ENK38_01950 [Gammaproteobacteria bacterium]|nr:hypothetical protein [Gammaproteobacteria bacterium]
MNANAEKVTESTELTLVERARQALSVEHTETQLAELAAKNADVVEINDDNDYALVKNGITELRNVRFDIEGAGKIARDDANKFAKAVIAEERRLTGIIKPEEDRLKALKKEVDDRVKAEKEAKRNAEANRIAAIQDDIEAIKQMAMLPAGATAETIRNVLAEATATTIDASYAEFSEAAVNALTATTNTLNAALTERVEFEHQQAEIAAQREELEAQRREQEARETAQREEQARLQAEKDEAERQRREAEERERKAEEERRELLRKENERLEAEQKRKEEEERQMQEAAAEAERIEREAEEAKAKREAQKPARDKIIEWAESLSLTSSPETGDKELDQLAFETAVKIRNAAVELVDSLTEEPEDDLF